MNEKMTVEQVCKMLDCTLDEFNVNPRSQYNYTFELDNIVYITTKNNIIIIEDDDGYIVHEIEI